MKKALYLIPVILLALCLAHVSLHNDAVYYKPGGTLNSLQPGHWKMRDYNLDASASVSQAAAANSPSTQNEAYSQGAKFYGFPFGFYFSNDLKSSVSSLTVSAYSWLWGLVDGLLIVITLLLAWIINRRPKAPDGLTAYMEHLHDAPTTPPTGQTPPPSTIYPTPTNT